MNLVFAKRVLGLEESGIRRIFDLASKMKNPVDLSLGQPDFDVCIEVKQAMVEAILSNANRYAPSAGIPELRAAIREHLQREGISTAEHNLVTSGASGGLLLALMVFADAGTDVYLCDPYFVAYPQMIRLAEAEPVFIDTYPDFRLTPARLMNAVREREQQLTSEFRLSGRRRILLFNYPNNPTGVTYSESELRELAAVSVQLGFRVISDEVYDRFSYEVPHVSWLRFDPEAVLVRSFSKMGGMPGWRIGYACAPEPVLEQMLKIQQYSFTCVNTPGQRACIKLLERDFGDLRETYLQRRNLLVAAAPAGLELNPPGGGFFAFVRCPIPDAELFLRRSLEHEVLVVPGSMFSRRNTHFRLSFSAHPARLKRGLELLALAAKSPG